MADLTQTNVTDSTRAEFYRKALAAKRELENKQEQARTANGRYRGVLKEAKKAGVDTDALTRVLNERLEDPDVVLKRDQEYLRLRILTGGILRTQLDLFTPLFKPDIPPETAEALSLERIYEDGVTAGRAGVARDNPYIQGSSEYDTWDRAWLEGQKANLPAQAPRKPRKGKLTVVKDEEPNQPATTH